MIKITLLGIYRDRIFQGIMVFSVIFFLVPFVSSLSMRQVTELSVTLSLSLISFILFLLAVFLGSVSVWRDIERRYTLSVLSLPITRSAYLAGKFAGMAAFLLLTAILLGVVSSVVIYLVSSATPPDRPLVWENIWAAIIFDSLKYILLIAIAMLFSSMSTSFFLPVFGTISIFFIGNASQQAYDYIHSASGLKALSPLIRETAGVLYYLVPNFSAFNFKLNAIYGLPIKLQGLIVVLGYFAVYTAIVIVVACIVFKRREMK